MHFDSAVSHGLSIAITWDSSSIVIIEPLIYLYHTTLIRLSPQCTRHDNASLPRKSSITLDRDMKLHKTLVAIFLHCTVLVHTSQPARLRTDIKTTLYSLMEKTTTEKAQISQAKQLLFCANPAR